MNRVQPTREREKGATARIARLYAVTPEEPDTRILSDRVHQALEGGARVVQYRNKSSGRLLRRVQAEALCRLCRDAQVPFIVNDDLELALSVGADGLHVGREDVDNRAGARCARRRQAPRRLVLRPSRSGARRVQTGADYVAFGSAFPSPTKPGATRAPLALFREARARLDIPIVAIGGITRENARSVIDAGADAIAVMSALFDAPDIRAAASAFDRLFTRESQ